MTNINVKVKRLHPDAILPQLATTGSAGFDLVAVEGVIIEPGETALVKTGLAFELPPGYEMQIRPRLGITVRTKLRVQLGTVGADYRGEVGVIVDNTCGKIPYNSCHLDGLGETISGEEVELPGIGLMYGSYEIRKGDCIAQAVIQRLPSIEFTESESLGETERGAGLRQAVGGIAHN